MNNQTSNFLSVDFKKTESVPVSSSLRNYIAQASRDGNDIDSLIIDDNALFTLTSSKEAYSEDPEVYLDDFRSLDNLRNEIITLESHSASLARLQKYYGQIIYLGAKFPINENSIRICFPWYCVFGKERRSISSFSLSYERACILFNMGSLYSQLGLAESRQTSEGLKRSALYYQSAAGVFKAIQDQIANGELKVPFCPDFQNTTLTALMNLMLAQAQESFWQKAVGDKKTDATIAKLAAKVSDFYDAAHFSAVASAVFSQQWIIHVQVKSLHFNAAAQFRRGCEALAAGKYGEEIARLQIAEGHVKKAMEYQKQMAPAVLNDLKGLAAVLQSNLQRAEKDNNIIYLDIIPKTDALAAIARAEMVAPTSPPDLGSMSEVVGQPFFAKLVPFAVHQAVSLYSSQKENLVNGEADRAKEATATCHSTLQSLNLPGAIEALEQPIGIPPAVLQRSEEVRKSGGVSGLQSTYETVLALSVADVALLDEAMKALDNEAKEDDEARHQFGKDRWTRTPSRDLTGNLRDTARLYREKLDMARKSDMVVRTKIDNNFAVMTSLSSSRDELEAAIPSSKVSTTVALTDPTVKEVKALLAQLNDIIKRRAVLVEDIKKLSKDDDVAPKLMEATSKQEQVDNEALFAQQLKKYDPLVSQIKQSILEQTKLLEDVRVAHKRFMDSRQTNDMIKQRESALNNLEAAYRTFKEISGNLQEGIKFYTDIQLALTRFKDNCTDFVYARSLDRRDNLTAIQNAIAGLSVSSTSDQHPLPLPPRPGTSSSSGSSGNRTPPGGHQPGVWQPGTALNYGTSSPAPQPGVWQPGSALNYGPPSAPPYQPQQNLPGGFSYSNNPPRPGQYSPYNP
ncbi:hypothetical protein SmJEL517_g04211 [Synchytrium microbalum]|uniref:BRO1 domain-containing protein n=1 Tax=Synchytrium microbalum TaxID=1806994 RepID=A0A507BV04_9FUNG|nr:uncharacterized protein SmJEL517_g04211 [Synchytrium microbalum]TPX32747.1 hypothetical protein SmJEL517_g04211 [Synchytrium microbalum]